MPPPWAFAATATVPATPREASTFIRTLVQRPGSTFQVSVWVPVPAVWATRKVWLAGPVGGCAPGWDR